MNILVTAGPTREYFDTVRFISNPSSGKMGYAIAQEAARRGHQVTLVSGPVALSEPADVNVIQVVSAREMFDAVVAHFEQCHAVGMTAAVCDYRPRIRLDRKLEKQDCVKTVELEPTTDILTHLGTIRTHQVLIGFAMEDHDERSRAEGKLQRKGCDAIVLNGIGNVGADAATIEILRADSGWSPAKSGSKAELACEVVDLAESLVSARQGRL